MLKSSDYKELKLKADKKYNIFESLPCDTSPSEIKNKYNDWYKFCENILINNYPIESLEDLKEFAGEGIECIKKMDKAHENFPEYFKEQQTLAIKIYKKADEYVYNLSNKYGISSIQRNPYILHTIDELRAIQKWCHNVQTSKSKVTMHTQQNNLLQETNKPKKNRPKKAEMDNRNRVVAYVATKYKFEHGCLPCVDDIIAATQYTRNQIYATSVYKEENIAKNSAKSPSEITRSSIQRSEYFTESSEEHCRANRRSRTEQAELDALIETQKMDDESDRVM